MFCSWRSWRLIRTLKSSKLTSNLLHELPLIHSNQICIIVFFYNYWLFVFFTQVSSKAIISYYHASDWLQLIQYNNLEKNVGQRGRSKCSCEKTEPWLSNTFYILHNNVPKDRKTSSIELRLFMKRFAIICVIKLYAIFFWLRNSFGVTIFFFELNDIL